MPRETPQDRTLILTAAGLPTDAAAAWNDALPACTAAFASDRYGHSDFWLRSARLIARRWPTITAGRRSF